MNNIVRKPISIPDDAQWYTPQEVAALFRVDPKTVVRWEQTGKLAEHDVIVTRTPGNHRRYSRVEIDVLWESLNG